MVLDALADRLEDRTFVRWTEAELTRYVREALRTWNALTGTFMDLCVFNTTTDQPFYDLPTVAPAQRGYTVTDLDLVKDIQDALLEPSGVPWTGSGQFTLSDLVSAIRTRRDQFLLESGAVQTRTVRNVNVPPQNGRVPLDQAVMTLRRVAWVTEPEETVHPLQRDDEWSLNNFSRAWVQNPARPGSKWPIAYSVGVTPPLVCQIGPPPLDTGRLDMVSINQGAAVDPTSPTVLGVPDDWCWIVKFGALVDLLNRDGLALDPARSAYCQMRWEHGIRLAAAAPVVLTARVNNVVMPIVSLADMDAYSRSWQSTSGVPKKIILAGQNLVALGPPPNNGAPSSGYAVRLDVVRNAYVPVLTTDYLQIGEQSLDTILDYSQHLALFKEGPMQLETSQALLQRFLRTSGINTSLTWSSVPNRGAMLNQQRQDERAQSRLADVGAS